MKNKVVKVIYIFVFIILVITGICLYESEDFDHVRSLEGKGEYLLHTEPLVPRESPDLFIAEEGKLFLFYIDTELVNVYTVSGEFLYGLQFPHGQNGISDMICKDGTLYVDARGSGIYVFRDTQLVRFEQQHYQNEGHHELEEVFTGEEDHKDGAYTYAYVEDTNKILRQNSAGSETVLQFPQRKYDPLSFLWLILLMVYVGKYIWSEKR